MIQSVRSGIYLPGVCSLGSRLDSALSRTMSVSLEDKKGCRGIKSSGFSMPAPVALGSSTKKRAREAGNWMDRWTPPNRRSLTRPRWKTARAMVAFTTSLAQTEQWVRGFQQDRRFPRPVFHVRNKLRWGRDGSPRGALTTQT